MLSVLMVIEEHLPAIHLPPASFEDLSEGQMRLVESELPAATTPALERFAPGIFKIAQEVERARAKDQAIREAKARRARIRAQFATLPAGTMLIHRGRSDQIAVVSDERGRQSSRSLDLFTAKRGSTPRKVDMTLQNREDFVLFTPGKVRKLQGGFVSAHQIMKGLAQAKELGPAYPDLLPSPLFDFMW